MDLHFPDETPTEAERAAVDALLGAPTTSWEGADARTAGDTRVVRLGREARERRHLLLPALAQVQSEIGWISPGALTYVCRRLSVPPAEAYGVATFYALLSLEERPPRVAHVCDDVVCREQGADGLIADLEDAIGPEGASSDGQMWVRSPCLGRCETPTAVYCQRAGVADTVVPAADVEQVLEALQRDEPTAPAVEIPQAGQPGLRVLRRIGVVDPTDLDDYRTAGGYDALRRTIEMGPRSVLREVDDSGLKGRGGAAFPVGIKWNGVATNPERPHYLICNADESEPGTFKDRVIMEGDPFAVIEAMTIAGSRRRRRAGLPLHPRGVPGRYRPAARCDRRVPTTGAARRRRHGGRLRLRRRAAAGAGCLHLWRGDGAVQLDRGQARRAAQQAAVPDRRRPVRQADRGQQRRDAGQRVRPSSSDGARRSRRSVGTEVSPGTRLFCLSGRSPAPVCTRSPFGARCATSSTSPAASRRHAPGRAAGRSRGLFVTPDGFDMALTLEDTRAPGSRWVGRGDGIRRHRGPDRRRGAHRRVLPRRVVRAVRAVPHRHPAPARGPRRPGGYRIAQRLPARAHRRHGPGHGRCIHLRARPHRRRLRPIGSHPRPGGVGPVFPNFSGDDMSTQRDGKTGNRGQSLETPAPETQVTIRRRHAGHRGGRSAPSSTPAAASTSTRPPSVTPTPSPR
jgi:NADH-quinone oxidoreductase subunit F